MKERAMFYKLSMDTSIVLLAEMGGYCYSIIQEDSFYLYLSTLLKGKKNFEKGVFRVHMFGNGFIGIADKGEKEQALSVMLRICSQMGIESPKKLDSFSDLIGDKSYPFNVEKLSKGEKSKFSFRFKMFHCMIRSDK